MKKSRPKRVFNQTFKLSVLCDYYSSGLSQYAIAKKYALDNSILRSWLKKYPVDSKELSLPATTLESYKMSKQQSELSETEKLRKRIADLQRSLELERMRSRAFEKMIEIAEQEEGISILKKDGAKR